MAPNTALKSAIFQGGTTQLEICKKSRGVIDEPRMSRIVRGHVAPTDEEKRVIARVLRMPVNQLFPEVAA